MAAQYFINLIRGPQIQNSLRLRGFKNSTDVLVRALKLEATLSTDKYVSKSCFLQEAIIEY